MMNPAHANFGFASLPLLLHRWGRSAAILAAAAWCELGGMGSRRHSLTRPCSPDDKSGRIGQNRHRPPGDAVAARKPAFRGCRITTNRPAGLLAFTLIELLVVISIIGILAGLTVGLSGVASRKSKESRIRGDLNRLVTVIENYKARLGSYPPSPDGLTRKNK